MVAPSERSEAGYRLDAPRDLERLQLVLFYRELGFGLAEIGELQAEAEQRWGDTDAYRESRRRTADHTRQDWEELKAESEAIMPRIAAVYRSGEPADSDAAMDAVEAHRRQITERFYDRSHEMQVQLGESYVRDPRFTATYEAIEPGLTIWVRDAIRANAERATT